MKSSNINVIILSDYINFRIQTVAILNNILIFIKLVVRNKIWNQYFFENKCPEKLYEIICGVHNQNPFSNSDVINLFEILSIFDLYNDYEIQNKDILNILNATEIDLAVETLIFSDIFFMFLSKISASDELELNIFTKFLNISKSSSCGLIDFSKLSLIKNFLMSLAQKTNQKYMDIISSNIFNLLKKKLDHSAVKMLWDMLTNEQFYQESIYLLENNKNKPFDENKYLFFLDNIFNIFDELSNAEKYNFKLIFILKFFKRTSKE